MPSNSETLLNVNSILSAKLHLKRAILLRVICAQNYDGPGLIEMKVQGHRPKKTSLSYDAPLLKIQGSLRYRRADADEVFKLAKKAGSIPALTITRSAVIGS